MTPAPAPSLFRRLACVLYDGLLVGALLLVATFPFVAITRAMDPVWARHLLQVYLVLVTGGYFTLFWRKGQTLAMKTWRIRLESVDGTRPSRTQVWVRFVLACVNPVLLGVGWWSALLRPERQFLQDRLAGTRLVETGAAHQRRSKRQTMA